MKPKYTSLQLFALTALRVSIGWHFFYEGFTKLLNPNWSSAGYLNDSQGWFAGLFHAIAGNQSLLAAADFLNVWGLIAVGVGLLIGIFSRYAALGGMLLLAFYYLSHPPLMNASYSLPSEGSYLWINKNIIELFALWLVFLFNTSSIIGIDRLLKRK